MTTDKHITIIHMKLCRPIGSPVDEFWDAINECGYKCDVARNAMFRHWLRWREDHPDWTPDVKTNDDGTPRLRKSGDLIVANCPAPSIQSNEQPAPKGSICRWCRGDNKAKAIVARENTDGDFEPVCEKHRLVSFSTVLYRAGCLAVSDLSATIMATMSAEVWDNLTANALFVPGNKALYRWQAYIDHEANLPSCRGRTIPVSNRALQIGWDECCWVQFPLWSKSRGTTSVKVECKVSGLPAGKKRILQKAIAGELKISDSKLVSMKAKNGADWELHLIVQMPNKQSALDPSRTILLEAADKDGSRPFMVTLPDGTKIPVGRGIPVWREYERLTLRRKAIRGGYRLGAMKGGHGKRRIMAKVTSESRRYGGVQSAFHRDLADIVYRIAYSNNCGTVTYDEPPVNARDKLWFGSRNVPFDWTSQKARLVGKFKRLGIEFVCLNDLKRSVKRGKKISTT